MRGDAGVGWIGCLLAIACGGRSNQGSTPEPEAVEVIQGGAGGETPSADAPASGRGGEPSVEASGGDGGTLDRGPDIGIAGGGGGPPAAATVVSGVRFCENARECRGLECRAPGSDPEQICVVSCANGNERACSAEQLCITVRDLEPVCLARCDWPTDCAYRFDCYDWYEDGRYVCVPTAWLH